MNAILKVELLRHEAYLTTATGEVYHVWFAEEPYPFVELLTPTQIGNLEVLRKQTL